MIRVFDGVLPAEVCVRVLDALRAHEAQASGDPTRTASVALSEMSPALDTELHTEHLLPLLWDVLSDDPRLSATRSALLPELTRLLRERPPAPGEAASTEPVEWPERDGLCVLVCVSEPAGDAVRVFGEQGKRIGHERGRAIVCPTNWRYDYALRLGDGELVTLAAFVVTSPATRVYPLGPEMNREELRYAALLNATATLSATSPGPSKWPSPPLKRSGDLEPPTAKR